jgi:hypothetical protein
MSSLTIDLASSPGCSLSRTVVQTGSGTVGVGVVMLLNGSSPRSCSLMDRRAAWLAPPLRVYVSTDTFHILSWLPMASSYCIYDLQRPSHLDIPHAGSVSQAQRTAIPHQPALAPRCLTKMHTSSRVAEASVLHSLWRYIKD